MKPQFGSDLIVDIQPDGDLMFDPGDLWTAAHEGIPMLAVMYNNRGYYNDWAHQIRLAKQRGNPARESFCAPSRAQLLAKMNLHIEGTISAKDQALAASRELEGGAIL